MTQKINLFEPSERIRNFENLEIHDLSLFGGKNANLGELKKISSQCGFAVPDGFAISIRAFDEFITYNGLNLKISALMDSIHKKNNHLAEKSNAIRSLFKNAKMPDSLKSEILIEYRKLNKTESERFAVRSSAITEDLPTASFAGLHDSYLNLSDESDLIDHIILCFASLYNERAISYRMKKNIPHENTKISVAIQKMIRSDLSVSGVMFTLDTETGFENNILIESSYGLGETIVQGIVTPDQFTVFKPMLSKGYSPIIDKKSGSKEWKSVYTSDSTLRFGTKLVPVPTEDRNRFSLKDEEILLLSRWGIAIENHYSNLNSKTTHMDIEWGKDGISGEFFILQARPETVYSQKKITNKLWQNYSLDHKSEIIAKGSSVGNSIASGKARIIHRKEDLHLLKWGEILITDKTDPDWEPAMKNASAIVTNRGGRTCHAAIIAREIGIPAIVGTSDATFTIKDHQAITVSSAEGPIGYVYNGELPISVKPLPEVDTSALKTKVMMNIANPDEAIKMSMLPNDGVGLARFEFVISSAIRIHPMAIAHFNDLKSEELKQQIGEIAKNHGSPESFFVETLSQKVATIVSAFHPKPVTVRFSDFKSNEYRNLIGGTLFEKIEENPMLGFRGASRYIHPDYRDAFALECKAMKLVLEKMGLDNMKLLIPFCRTEEEAEKVLLELSKNGITRNHHLDILMMCEIPSNAIDAEKFLNLFDGFSIGSNDLTQLTLGMDRDSELLAPQFDEKNSAVVSLIQMAITKAKTMKKTIGICGQAPSDDAQFTEMLVAMGIDSISLNPDSITKIIPVIQKAEFQPKPGTDHEKKKERHSQPPGLQPTQPQQ